VGVAAACVMSGQMLLAVGLAPYGTEYRVTAPMGGDQVCPQLALGADGGYLVWHDNQTDGYGYGISARRLDANFSGEFESFRVNEIGAGDQENPQVALLNDGGAVFVWQGGNVGQQRIYARFMRPDRTFRSGDVQVNTYNRDAQEEPSVAVMADGSVVIVWESYGQDGSHSGVFGQRFSAAGERLGAEFIVNQSTLNNQRDPAITAVPGGGFHVVWINEHYRGMTFQSAGLTGTTDSAPGAALYDVQVMGRGFDSNGSPNSIEQVLSDEGRIAANPSVAVDPSGRMLVAWSSMSANQGIVVGKPRDRWDVVALAIDSAGRRLGDEYVLNSQILGDQFRPKVTALGSGFMTVWTSLAQDGAREGVIGRSAGLNGPVGDEMIVNTFTPSQQIYPAVATKPGDDSLIVWSSFVGGSYSFELLAQRMAAVPEQPAPTAPFVTALSPSQLVVTWAALEGVGLAAYELYLDGAVEPVAVGGNRHYLTKLLPGSTHQVRLAYRFVDGTRSALSAAGAGTTWGIDESFDGLPDDWQTTHFGTTVSAWPGTSEDSDGDGATNLQEFLAGTNPADPDSVLKLALQVSEQGTWLLWDTNPGSIYQVQVSDDLGEWTPVTAERFAAGIMDSVQVDGTFGVLMYRVVRIR